MSRVTECLLATVQPSDIAFSVLKEWCLDEAKAEIPSGHQQEKEDDRPKARHIEI